MQRTEVSRVGGNEVSIKRCEQDQIDALSVKLIRILARQLALDESGSHANVTEGDKQ